MALLLHLPELAARSVEDEARDEARHEHEAISTNAAAQACAFRCWSGASEYSKMVTGIDATGSRRVRC